VTWRAEKVARGQLSIRADIKIPQRQMSVVLKMSRNTDPELRASHVIDIVFNRDIANVPGILMKNSEQERGTPLAGLAVKYQQTSFLVGLPSADVQRNVELLKDGSWFDIPFVYRNGGRGIIAVQKGEAGNRLLAEAFLSWGQ